MFSISNSTTERIQKSTNTKQRGSSTTFADIWKVDNFIQRFETIPATPIDSPKFIHIFNENTVRCKARLYYEEKYHLLVIESQVERVDNISIKVQCFLRNSDGVEIRLSAAKSDGEKFKHVIQSSIVTNMKNNLISNDVLTIIVKIIASAKQDYKKVKDVRLGDDFGNLLQTGNFSDVNLTVGSYLTKAHKAILSCRSSTFASIFQEEDVETVEIKNFNVDVISEMLSFCYTGSVGKVTGQLLRASDEFDIAGLKIVCEDALFSNLGIENAAAMLIRAERCHASTLKNKCVEFIGENMKEVVKTSNFKLLSKTTIIDILLTWSEK